MKSLKPKSLFKFFGSQADFFFNSPACPVHQKIVPGVPHLNLSRPLATETCVLLYSVGSPQSSVLAQDDNVHTLQTQAILKVVHLIRFQNNNGTVFPRERSNINKSIPTVGRSPAIQISLTTTKLFMTLEKIQPCSTTKRCQYPQGDLITALNSSIPLILLSH